jgi:hypothetical protein
LKTHRRGHPCRANNFLLTALSKLLRGVCHSLVEEFQEVHTPKDMAVERHYTEEEIADSGTSPARSSTACSMAYPAY